MNGNTADFSANRGVILSACPVTAGLARYLKKDDFIIACDAGYRNAAALNCSLNLIVGDFDSAPRPDRPDLIVLPHVKDDTDTQYAAAWLADHGAKQVVLLGALGGKRFEHSLANLSTGLYLQKRGIDALIADEHSEIRFLTPEHCVVLQRENWEYFSVFPMEGTLEGVTIEGALYPLTKAVLRADYPLGVSNEFACDEVRVRCTKGSGIVIVTREFL